MVKVATHSRLGEVVVTIRIAGVEKPNRAQPLAILKIFNKDRHEKGMQTMAFL